MSVAETLIGDTTATEHPRRQLRPFRTFRPEAGNPCT